MNPQPQPFIPPPIDRSVDERWAGTRFGDYCARQRRQHGARFRPPTDVRWIEAYNNGERYRVKVRTAYGDHCRIRWGFVALTSGWLPSFMLMRVRGQRGSSDLLDERDEILESKWVSP